MGALRFMFALAIASAACSSTARGVDAGPGFDAGPGAGQGAACAGQYCAVGQVCCLATGACFDPSNRSACAAPAGGTFPVACASNLDCSADEYCQGLCIGVGTCSPRTGCAGTCGGCPATRPPVCGCDGRTYSSLDDACAAGVRVGLGSGACGVPPTPAASADAGGEAGVPRAVSAHTGCGGTSQCAPGETCCALYGYCVPADCTWCCTTAPPGTSFPCGHDSDCSPQDYCAGTGCGTPGGCVGPPTTLECSGEVVPVCGCNGRTYTNECWARAAKTRVASSGPCDGG